MKKEYIKPYIDVTIFDIRDVITESGPTNSEEEF